MQITLDNGIALEYDEFGTPESPAILLIMGLGTQMTAWSEPFCQLLVERGFRVIRFDNRDVGLSHKCDGQRAPTTFDYLRNKFFGRRLPVPYTLSDMAADAAGLLRALEITQAHIVGASMGGMIGQILSAQQPDKVLSFTSIMSSSGNPRLPSADRQVMRHLYRRPKGSQELQFKHSIETYRLIESPKYLSTDEELQRKVQASIDRAYYPQGFARQMAAIIADGSRVKRLQQITAPTLVIHGTADRLVPMAAGKDTAKHIPGAWLELIDGMGHDLPEPLWAPLANLIGDHAVNAVSQ